MTAVPVPLTPTARTRSDRPPLGRLVAVELRKAVDTRAGRWLLIAVGVLALGAVAIQAIVAEPRTLSFEALLSTAQLPVGILLPVLGILSVTSEWSQRTALTTFTLVPRRSRMVLAKLLAAVVLALMALLCCVGAAAAGNLLAVTTQGAEGIWTISATLLGHGVVFGVLNVLMGVGFGMLLLNSPLAIVLYFLIPTVFSFLGALVSGLRSAAEWLDTSLTMLPLLGSTALTQGEWGRLAASSALWIALPLLAGLVRVQRREVS